MPNDTIADFWNWWRGAAPRFAEAFDTRRPLTADEIEEITSRVSSVQDGLVWEFGPGRGSRHALTVSAEGNIVLRRLTERLVQAGPAPDDTWEYYPARQPVPDFSLAIAGQTLDADQWRFVLDVDESRLLINLEAFHPKLKKLPKEASPQAGFIAVDQMFGEDAVETWFGALEFTDRDKRVKATARDVAATIERLAVQSREDLYAIAQGTDAEGNPLFFTYNQRLKRLHHLFADILVEVELTLEHPTEHGLTTDDEATELNEIEDKVRAAASSIVDVGRLTGRGRRNIYFYAEDALAVRQRIEATLGACTNKTFEVRTRPDPEWRFYREEMFGLFASAG